STRRRRVGSPSAAKTGAASASLRTATLRPRDIARDVLGLLGPPLLVHAERLTAARERNAVEPRLDDGELGRAVLLFQAEFDERRGLGRIVDLRINRVRVPAKGEVALGVDPLDQHLQRQVLVPG